MKLKKCKECSNLFTPARPLQSVCSHNCAIAYQKKRSIIKKNKEERKEIAELKAKLLTHKDYLKILQVQINTIIRLIDKDCGCICTGSKNGKMNAGHYASVGSNPTLRFHLDNIHLQSEHSNTYLSGDILRYQQGLKNTYGIKYFNHVNSLSLIEPIKLGVEEIKEKIKIAKGIIKELKDRNDSYTEDTRILLRKLYNEKLAIYK